MPMTREEAAKLALDIRRRADIPYGAEVVVVVTDAEGAWVGVSSTESSGRTSAILEAALRGAGYRTHADVIDMGVCPQCKGAEMIVGACSDNLICMECGVVPQLEGGD